MYYCPQTPTPALTGVRSGCPGRGGQPAVSASISLRPRPDSCCRPETHQETRWRPASNGGQKQEDKLALRRCDLGHDYRLLGAKSEKLGGFFGMTRRTISNWTVMGSILLGTTPTTA